MAPHFLSFSTSSSILLTIATLLLPSTLSVTISPSSTSSTLATLSITSYLPYAAQRGCVQDCLYDGSDWVGSYIGCGSPYYNLCYCNANFGSSATAYISACVSSICSGGLDAPTAVSVYTAYCAGAGLPLGVAAVQTGDGGNGGAGSQVTQTQTLTGMSTVQLSGGSVTTVPVTVTNLVTTSLAAAAGQTTPTSPAATGTPAAVTSNGSPPLGAILGGALGGAALLGIAAVLIVFFVLRHRRWVRQQEMQQFQQQQMYQAQEPKPSPGPTLPVYTSPVDARGNVAWEGSREMDSGREAAMLEGRPKPAGSAGYGVGVRELPG